MLQVRGWVCCERESVCAEKVPALPLQQHARLLRLTLRLAPCCRALVAVGTLAAEHSKVRRCCTLPPARVFLPALPCLCLPDPLPSPLANLPLPASPLQVRSLAKDLGFLSLTDSLKTGSGKVAEAAAEVAAKLRF